MRVERLAGFQYAVSQVEKLTHNGTNHGHFGFAPLGESSMQIGNDGIETMSRKSWHKE